MQILITNDGKINIKIIQFNVATKAFAGLKNIIL